MEARVGSPTPLSSRRDTRLKFATPTVAPDPEFSPEQRRRAARELHAAGVPVAMIADAFRSSPRTIERDVAPQKKADPRTPQARKVLLIEAGVCFMKRNGISPTWVTWNPALARDSNEEQRRWSYEGWRSIGDPDTQRPWPLAEEAAKLWKREGGLHAFLADVNAAFREDLRDYTPVPLPRGHLARCALTARFPAPPGLTRANLWTEFLLLGPEYASLAFLHLERPHSDEWLRQRADEARAARGLPPRAAVPPSSERLAPPSPPELQTMEPGVGEEYFGDLPPEQLLRHDQRQALWQLRTLLAFRDLPYARPSNTSGAMRDDGVMTLLIRHSVTPDTFVRLEVGPGRLLLTWPLGSDDNGRQWNHRVVDLVDGLLDGRNRQVIISRRGRVLESTTMVVSEHCERLASVNHPGASAINRLLRALPFGRLTATRQIRFSASIRRPQHHMLYVASDDASALWRELGCSRTAVRAARGSFYAGRPNPLTVVAAATRRKLRLDPLVTRLRAKWIPVNDRAGRFLAARMRVPVRQRQGRRGHRSHSR
ncbi:hypothetical protein [Gaiella sp.]|uniref:hypothetical protein n=1 Tax=Gaiella sp. TaxID=2663207 RepID=UPI0039832DE1